MYLNDYGRVAVEEWRHNAEVRDNVELDAFIVMPNHVHGVVAIVDDNRRGTPPVCPYYEGRRRFGHAVPGSLSTIMRQYKSMVTKRVNRLWGTSGRTVWQRGFYEHVIRGRWDLERIRRYIEENPVRWGKDRYYVSG